MANYWLKRKFALLENDWYILTERLLRCSKRLNEAHCFSARIISRHRQTITNYRIHNIGPLSRKNGKYSMYLASMNKKRQHCSERYVWLIIQWKNQMVNETVKMRFTIWDLSKIRVALNMMLRSSSRPFQKKSNCRKTFMWCDTLLICYEHKTLTLSTTRSWNTRTNGPSNGLKQSRLRTKKRYQKPVVSRIYGYKDSTHYKRSTEGDHIN